MGIFAGVTVSYLGITYALRIFSLLDEEAIRVITRLMSIIVPVITLQFTISGIAETIPEL